MPKICEDQKNIRYILLDSTSLSIIMKDGSKIIAHIADGRISEPCIEYLGGADDQAQHMDLAGVTTILSENHAMDEVMQVLGHRDNLHTE